MNREFLPEPKNRAEFNILSEEAKEKLLEAGYTQDDEFIRDMQEFLAIKRGVYPPYWKARTECEKCGIVPSLTKGAKCRFCDSPSYDDYLHDKFHKEVFDNLIRKNIKTTLSNIAFMMLETSEYYDSQSLKDKAKMLWQSVVERENKKIEEEVAARRKSGSPSLT